MFKKKQSTLFQKAFLMIICMVITGYVFEFLVEFPSLEANSEGVLIEIDRPTAEQVGLMIYHNECSSKEQNLLFWNEKEEFPSLGIGHFIWFHENSKVSYEETFPKFIKFLQTQNCSVPEWLQDAPRCPWLTRDDFYKALKNNDPKMNELRHLIISTISQQTQFIVQRFHKTFSEIYNQLQSKPHAQLALYKMTQTPLGLYALIDYVNFKGSGLNPSERRNGAGWGLLQVVERMSQKSHWLHAPEKAFSTSAVDLLTERAESSPDGKEKKFLPGWVKRCKTYSKSK